jgi:hypothetical protein
MEDSTGVTPYLPLPQLNPNANAGAASSAAGATTNAAPR